MPLIYLKINLRKNCEIANLLHFLCAFNERDVTIRTDCSQMNVQFPQLPRAAAIPPGDRNRAAVIVKLDIRRRCVTKTLGGVLVRHANAII